MTETPLIVLETSSAASQLAAIAAFYRRVGYTGLMDPEDDVVLAKHQGEIVGVVRLAVEHAVNLLRGMNVASAWQGQGIGKRMLARFEMLVDARRADEVFLTCGPHLVPFYGTIGFYRAGPSVEPPAFLEERRVGYSSRFGEQIIMYRLAPR